MTSFARHSQETSGASHGAAARAQAFGFLFGFDDDVIELNLARYGHHFWLRGPFEVAVRENDVIDDRPREVDHEHHTGGLFRDDVVKLDIAYDRLVRSLRSFFVHQVQCYDRFADFANLDIADEYVFEDAAPDGVVLGVVSENGK